jgi:beta-mannosidase
MSGDPVRRLRHEVYDECRGRFVSEFGAIGPCHMDSIRQYLRPGERHRGHHTWKLHSNSFEKGITAEAIRYHYADPECLSLAEFVLYGQMFQAIMLGRATEAFRFRKNDPKYECQGSLVWSYSDCWGETGWSVIDYYGRRKASYYWLRRACAPVKVIVRARGHRLVTRVVNDTRREHAGTVTFGWFRVDGAARRVQSRRVRIPANGMVEAGSEEIPAPGDMDRREWVYGAVLTGRDIETDQAVWPLLPHRELAPVAPAIRARKTPKGWEACSPAYCHGVCFNDHGHAVLSDNYFDLLPGIPKILRRVDGGDGLPRFRTIVPGRGGKPG